MPPTTVAALFLAGCSAQFTRVPPGQSAMFARAQRAQFIAAAPSTQAPGYSGMGTVEPPLPSGAAGDTVNDYYALGSFCLQQERNEEAISAFQKVVQLDPNYADAWNSLAICYQNTGETTKALEAFKKYKALTAH
jgi:tetratricopeptide (TPR) repeat protein